jgi:hypothetical protein
MYRKLVLNHTEILLDEFENAGLQNRDANRGDLRDKRKYLWESSAYPA